MTFVTSPSAEPQANTVRNAESTDHTEQAHGKTTVLVPGHWEQPLKDIPALDSGGIQSTVCPPPILEAGREISFPLYLLGEENKTER